jgi:hypothetical protein
MRDAPDSNPDDIDTPDAPDTMSAAERARARLRAGTVEKKPRTMLYLASAGVVVVAIVFVIVKMGEHAGHELTIDRPVARAGGEVAHVGHAVKAGDAFAMAVTSKTGVALGDGVDPMQGMKLYATMTWEHTIAAQESGKLGSIVGVHLETSGGDLPVMPSFVLVQLGGDAPLKYLLDREADGTPVAGSGRVLPGAEPRRRALEYLLSGLTDLSTNYLPPREVHIGEVWNLEECAKLGEIVEAIRFLATLIISPAGFPQGTATGTVGAEALESKDGEPCLRLKLALEIKIEGDVTGHTKLGWISAVAKVEGSAWVALSTGILWGLETRSVVKSTYDNGLNKDERRARQVVVGTTKRKT